MSIQDLTTSAEVDSYLAQQNALDLLRFITCGSVDDGKSTLIGRMLYEAQLVFEDQVATLLKDSKKLGTQGGDIDFALLVDGLAAEREQGITIDVAYRTAILRPFSHKLICATSQDRLFVARKVEDGIGRRRDRSH